MSNLNHAKMCFASADTYPEQEGEFRISVADVAVLPIRYIHQCHDYLTQTHEGAIDTAGLLQKKPSQQQLLQTREKNNISM